MTKEVLFNLIKAQGQCSDVDELQCSEFKCPFYRTDCREKDIIYKWAIEIYIKRYGKENLVEELI